MWRQSLPNLLEARRWAAPMAEATDLRALRKPAADLALAARVADAAERRAALILAVRELMLAFMAASTSLASLARAPAKAVTLWLVFLIFLAVSVLRARRERFMVPTASLSLRWAAFLEEAMERAMAARPAAFFLAAAASLALATVKATLATLTAATRFFLASDAAERTAYRSSRFISARALEEERRRFSIWEADSLASLDTSEVIRMLREALVFLFMSLSFCSAFIMRTSPLCTAPWTAALSSILLAFMIAASWERPWAFFTALARTTPASLSILPSNFLSLRTMLEWRAAMRLEKSVLAARSSSAMSRRALRVWAASLPLTFIWAFSDLAIAAYSLPVSLASMWEAWARFLRMVERTLSSSVL